MKTIATISGTGSYVYEGERGAKQIRRGPNGSEFIVI